MSSAALSAATSPPNVLQRAARALVIYPLPTVTHTNRKKSATLWSQYSCQVTAMRLSHLCTLALLLSLGACGAGETAATASLQAQQAEQAQQQMEQLKQQIDQANAANAQRLQEALKQQQ